MDQTPSPSELQERELLGLEQPGLGLPSLELPDFDLLERRLGQMRELAGVIEQAQAAVVKGDLRGIERLTARQRELCNPLRAVGALPMSQGCHSRRWNTLADELAMAGERVRDLNRMHAALLRRARRTVDIFCRVLASSGNTYAPPRRNVLLALQSK